MPVRAGSGSFLIGLIANLCLSGALSHLCEVDDGSTDQVVVVVDDDDDDDEGGR